MIGRNAAKKCDDGFEKKTRNQKQIPGFFKKAFGDVLLSRPVSRAVPSALKSLTSVFGMGTGVASSPLPPKKRWL
jgi:hypothetical protein